MRFSNVIMIVGILSICVLFAFVLLPFAFDILDRMQIPSAEKLQLPSNPSRAFIVDGQEFVGIYGNYDVDSAIYKYESSILNEDEFWARISSATIDQNWELRSENSNWKRFVRIRHKGKYAYHSVEEVRISFDGDLKKVTLAWGQADYKAVSYTHLTLPTIYSV